MLQSACVNSDWVSQITKPTCGVQSRQKKSELQRQSELKSKLSRADCISRQARPDWFWPGAKAAEGRRARRPGFNRDYTGHNYTGHNYLGHNYTGHNYMGHNYIGHNYTGHDYTGHNYMGHN